MKDVKRSMDISGVGPKKAKELVQQGFTSIEMFEVSIQSKRRLK